MDPSCGPAGPDPEILPGGAADPLGGREPCLGIRPSGLTHPPARRADLPPSPRAPSGNTSRWPPHSVGTRRGAHQVAGPCLGNVRATPTTSPGRASGPRLGRRPSGPASLPLPSALGPSHGRSNRPDVDGHGPVTRDHQAPGGGPRPGNTSQRPRPAFPAYCPRGPRDSASVLKRTDRHPDVPKGSYRGGGSPTSEYVRAASTPPYFRHTVAPVSGTATTTPKGDPPPGVQG